MGSVSGADHLTLEAHGDEATTVSLTINTSSDSTPSMPLQQRLAEQASANIDDKDQSRTDKPQVGSYALFA
jgi:hypothetical protein